VPVLQSRKSFCLYEIQYYLGYSKRAWFCAAAAPGHMVRDVGVGGVGLSEPLPEDETYTEVSFDPADPTFDREIMKLRS
jgi:hypothetical protein